MSNLTKRQIEIEERERHRIARDLHDRLGQQLSAIKLYLNTLNAMHNGMRNNKSKALISKSMNALDEAITDLSSICFNLMPGTLNTYGLAYAIEDLIDKMPSIDIEFTAAPNLPALDKILQINMFHIIQEFVSNSVKHGKAKKITLNLDYRRKDKTLKLALKDNGKGFNVTKMTNYKGMGLKNVSARVAFHHGRLKIKSSHSGTAYKIIIPLGKTS